MIAATFVIWFAASTAIDWASGYLSGLSDYLGAAATMAQWRKATVAPATRKMEDAVASLAVPWKWDILHRWKRSRRLGGSGSPATAGLLQMHKTTCEECSLEDRLLIVYDRDLCTKEEDDPNDAIVFFHPADVSQARKCELSCQLVGVVHFFTSCFDTPRTVELRNSRIAVRALANYVVALGSTKNLADYVLQQQADMLVRLLRFYHKSFPDMKQGCSSTESFAARVREFCNSCLPVCCGPKDQLSNLFMAVPTLKLPDAASGVYTKGFALLEDLQKMAGVLASCVLFDERVLASQFTPEITQLLLLAATSKERLAMQDVPVKYPIPPAVRLVNVYLEAAWLKDLAIINKQSNENPKELDKYVEGPVDDEKRSTGSLHSVQEPDGQHAEKYTPAFEDKDVEREDSLSDDDSTMSSQTTNQSSSYAPLISAVLQATGKQSLPDSDFLSDFDSAEDMDFAGPDACLKRLAELQDTVAECLRISQENLATDTRRRRRTASRKSKKDLRKYVSKPDLRRILREIDEAQGQEYEDSRVSAPSYRHDDTNVFLDYDAGMGFDAAGLFYQAQTMQTPTLLGHLNQRSKVTTQQQATTWQPQSQILYGLYAKKFQRALTKLGEMCSSLSQSKERSSEKKSLFSSLRKTRERPPGAEVTDPQGLLSQGSGVSGFELPPVVQVELGEALDVPTEESNPVFRKHKTDDSAGDPQPNGASAPARPEHESECLCNAKDYDQHSVLEGVPRTGLQCELRRSTLFIQRYCNMACLVLLSNAAEENEDFIYSLWKRCIGELGDLEVAARTWQHQDHQQINETKCAEVCFNSKLCSLRGSLDTQEDVKKWHLQLIQRAHGEFRRNSYINNINALSLGNTWIHATRSEDYESFKVTTDEPKDVPLATSV